MRQYSNKGLYSGYDKNHKERAALDYYATPTQEVTNILETINLSMNNITILEPCVGGGHMVQGIIDYGKKINEDNYKIIATDIKDRGYNSDDNKIETYYGLDFFDDNYGNNFPSIDYLIMNPPYSVIEPFMIRALEIPTKGVLMLARLQVLEGEKRYDKILRKNPPTDVYIYVDRIACFKNGIVQEKPAAIQAYAWFFWNFEKENKLSELHWIRRADKK